MIAEETASLRAHEPLGLRPLDTDIWVAETQLRFVVEMGRRMAVIRIRDSELLLHSPADLTDDLRRELAALGDVRYVVAASNLHGHASMGDYQRSYPDVELFAPPGLARKRPDLRFAAELGERPDPRWRGTLDHAVFHGHRLLDEIVLLHRPSKSLIVGDTCFNIEPGAPFLTRLWAWGLRMRKRTGPTPLFRRGIADKQAARESIDRILEWDFDRLIVGHGAIIESGGKEAFAEAWSWLPASQTSS